MRNIFWLIIFLAVAASATAKEYFKYTDQNGFVYWLDDKSKIPSSIPIQYSYEDKYGITSWVDDVSKIPDEFRNKSARSKENPEKSKLPTGQPPQEPRQYATKISINNNQIVVPVVFKNKGRKIKARMILDTGASVTTIYPALATRLNMNKNRLTNIKSIIANGTATDSLLTKVDYIEIDDKIVANSEVIVMLSNSNIGADGLLGNSFLRFFNFTIDYEKQLLRWN